MAISIDDVAPMDPNAAAPVESTAAPMDPNAAAPVESTAAPEIPDEVLKIPAFSALLRGSPPAVFAPTGSEQKYPELATVTSNYKALLDAGFGFYRPKDNSGMVFFNVQYISPEEIKVADEKGKLTELAAPIDELMGFFDENLSGGAEAPAAPAAVPGPSAPPLPASAQKAIAGTRQRALLPGGPTSGPTPGQGRLLNSILKPVV